MWSPLFGCARLHSLLLTQVMLRLLHPHLKMLAMFSTPDKLGPIDTALLRQALTAGQLLAARGGVIKAAEAAANTATTATASDLHGDNQGKVSIVHASVGNMRTYFTVDKWLDAAVPAQQHSEHAANIEQVAS